MSGLHNFSLFKKGSGNPSSQSSINNLYQKTNSGNTHQPRSTLRVLLFSAGCCLWSSCVAFGSSSPGRVFFSSARREMPFANQLYGFLPSRTARCWDNSSAFRLNVLSFLPASTALICLNHTALANGKSDFSMYALRAVKA